MIYFEYFLKHEFSKFKKIHFKKIEHFQTYRALALSNIIRGMSFIPKAEDALCRHEGVLYLLGQIITLNTAEQKVKRAKPPPKVPLVRFFPKIII